MGSTGSGRGSRRATQRVTLGLIALGVLSWIVALRVAGSTETPGRVDDSLPRRALAARRQQGDLLPAPAGQMFTPRAWRLPEAKLPEESPPAAGKADLVAALHARLVELDEEWPVSWHELASAALERFTTEIDTIGLEQDGRVLLIEQLIGRIDGMRTSPRVHGGLLAALGGLGASEPLLARLPADGEAQRSGLIGLAWAGAEAEVEQGVQLDPVRFVQEQPRGGLPVLNLLLSRLPDEATTAWLRAEILRPVDSLEDLFSRDLAVFALGTGVDRNTATQRFLRRLLFDTHPSVQRLRPSVSFVLANARGSEARETLMAWLRDPLVGELGKTMARWWMAEGQAMPGDIDALIAPLLDPMSDGHERILAVGGLLRRLDRADEAELQQIEDVLSMRVAMEEDDTPRLAAVTTLALAPGGWQRMAALEHALRTDPRPACRGWAATGLGRTTQPHTSEAQAILRGVLPFEQDPSVRSAIARALGAGG